MSYDPNDFNNQIKSQKTPKFKWSMKSMWKF